MRNRITIVSLVLLLILSGCQATPETASVASKNDGAFEAALESAAESRPETEADETVGGGEQGYTTSFTSTDGSIQYTADIEMPMAENTADVFRVTPHNITSEEAERVARALFNDADIYEYTTELSKAEIEESILKLRQHISDREALVEYYGGNEALVEQVQADYESRIAALEALYDSASDTVTPIPCEWVFHTEDYYAEQGLGIAYDDSSLLEIMATAWVDGTPYKFLAMNRESSDYRLHSIYAYIDDLLVRPAQKYSRDEITEDDVAAMTTQAEAILAGMNMGDWVIDSAIVGTRMDNDGGEPFHILTITACPVYNGVKVLHQPQLLTLKSEDAYAANYYYEEIIFTFSGGQLTSFFFESPLDVIDSSGDVALLPFGDITNRLETQMRLSSASYTLFADHAEVEITRAELGLARIRVQNSDSQFYLTPAYTFYGITTLYDENGMEITLPFSNNTTDDILLVINAVDGSIINTELGY